MRDQTIFRPNAAGRAERRALGPAARSLESVIEARSKDLRSEIDSVGENVGGKWDGRRAEGGEICTRRLQCCTKIDPEVFTFQRPMVSRSNLKLDAAAPGPAKQSTRGAGELMRGCEGVNKVFFVVKVGNGNTGRAVHQDVGGPVSDAGTHAEQPIGAAALGNPEPRWDADRIQFRTRRHRIMDAHYTEITIAQRFKKNLLPLPST